MRMVKKKGIIVYGGFSNDELFSEKSYEGYSIPAIFWTRKQAKIYYHDVRRMRLTEEKRNSGRDPQ